LKDGSLGKEILSNDNESRDIESIEAQPAMIIKKKLINTSLIDFKVYPF
jgi:hypothetical protein